MKRLNPALLRMQKGVSLSGLIVVVVILVLVGIVAMKLVPSVVDYYSLLKIVKELSQDPAVRGGTVAEVRKAFTKRAEMDDIKAISPQDLEIRKEGSELVLSFAYKKTIPLVGNASLVMDFEGSSAKQ